jgi:hypothetical protein
MPLLKRSAYHIRGAGAQRRTGAPGSMALGPVSQGGDWMRRRESLLTIWTARCSSAQRTVMRRERLVSISQMIRHMCVFVGRGPAFEP